MRPIVADKHTFYVGDAGLNELARPSDPTCPTFPPMKPCPSGDCHAVHANVLFDGVPADLLSSVLAACDGVAFEAGDELFEGEADALYLLTAGRVDVVHGAVTASFGPGAFFGEAALLKLDPQPMRATATEAGAAARVDRARLAELLRLAPAEVAANLAQAAMAGGARASEVAIDERLHTERVRVIGALSASVAHAVRNSISSVLMAAELIAESAAPEDRDTSVEVIRRAVAQITALTDEMLNYARATPHIELREVGVAELVETLDEQILQRLERDGFCVTRDIHADGSCRVDPVRFVRVLTALLRNAAEAMPRGGHLGLAVEAHGELLVWTVRDTGCGVPGEVMRTLFEPFTTHGKEGSAGLELAIARSIVEAHGGRITLRDIPDAGTVATVEVPRNPPPGDE